MSASQPLQRAGARQAACHMLPRAWRGNALQAQRAGGSLYGVHAWLHTASVL